MKQRRRLKITTFRRRTTVILREREVSTRSGSDRSSIGNQRVPERDEVNSRGQRPRIKIQYGPDPERVKQN